MFRTEVSKFAKRVAQQHDKEAREQGITLVVIAKRGRHGSCFVGDNVSTEELAKILEAAAVPL